MTIPYRELLERLYPMGVLPIERGSFPPDAGTIVFLGRPAEVVYPESRPPGSLPIYLEDGDDTELEMEYARFILRHFRNGGATLPIN